MWEVQESLLLQCQMSGRKQMEGGLQMNETKTFWGLLCQIQIYPLLHCIRHFINCSFDFAKHFEQRICFRNMLQYNCGHLRPGTV